MIAFQQLGDLYEDFTRLIVIYIFSTKALKTSFDTGLKPPSKEMGSKVKITGDPGCHS